MGRCGRTWAKPGLGRWVVPTGEEKWLQGAPPSEHRQLGTEKSLGLGLSFQLNIHPNPCRVWDLVAKYVELAKARCHDCRRPSSPPFWLSLLKPLTAR